MSRVNLLRDKDLNRTSYDVLYGILKTHELKFIQNRAIQTSQDAMVNTSCALIAGDPVKEIKESSRGEIKIDKISEDLEYLLLDEEEKSEDEFYTLEELKVICFHDKKISISDIQKKPTFQDKT